MGFREIQENWGNPKVCWKKAMKEELKEQKQNPQLQHTPITMDPKRFKKFLRKELNGMSYPCGHPFSLFYLEALEVNSLPIRHLSVRWIIKTVKQELS